MNWFKNEIEIIFSIKLLYFFCVIEVILTIKITIMKQIITLTKADYFGLAFIFSTAIASFVYSMVYFM